MGQFDLHDGVVVCVYMYSADTYAACVFSPSCAATPWIFVNLNTSNAADLRHQNEDSVTA